MTRGRNAEKSVSDEQLLETLTTLYDADETIAGGGVTTERVAEELPITNSTVKNRLRRLVGEEKVERDWGFTDSQGTLAYRPAQDETREIRADGGTDMDDTERGDSYRSCFIDPVVLPRENDRLRARYYEGSGISEPDGELVSVTEVPDDAGPGFGGWNTLKIPVDELDDYIQILEDLRDAIDDGRTQDTDTKRDGGDGR